MNKFTFIISCPTVCPPPAWKVLFYVFFSWFIFALIFFIIQNRMIQIIHNVLIIVWKIRCKLNVWCWDNWWVLSNLGKLLNLIVNKYKGWILHLGILLLKRIQMHNNRLNHIWLRLNYNGKVHWRLTQNNIRLHLYLILRHPLYWVLLYLYWLLSFEVSLRLSTFMVSRIR